MSCNYGVLSSRIGDLLDRVLQGHQEAIEPLARALEAAGQSAHVGAVWSIRIERVDDAEPGAPPERPCD